MEVVSSVLNIISLLWGGAARCTKYYCNLEENLNSLRIALDELKNLRDDVRRRVESDESRRMTRTNQVRGWLERVDATEREVDAILNDGTCYCGCCPNNCLLNHKFGKRVAKMRAAVEDLNGKGDFSIVAEYLFPASVEVLPQTPTLGLDLMFEKTWSLLGEDGVGIVGLFGMGGVGKTTLMKKINNEFLKRTHEFDVIIWVVVSKPLNVPKIRKDIAIRLGLVKHGKDAKGLVEDVKVDAQQIFEALMRKKFVLLLDDMWERLDLEIVGIPTPDDQNRSKILFSTRSEAVCGDMDADKRIKVECLNWDEAWNLFQNKVGGEALNSHPEIPRLAQVVAKECAGLPLALITIGRAMSSKKTLQEWKHAITTLKKSASEFSGMKDKVFSILKFSYDSLPSDTIRSCFLYCSLYPEDCSIWIEELIEEWIGEGEGFIDEFDDIDEAFNQGYDIIGNLKVSCLLESGDDEESDVKMHDVIRDLAIWIASEYGRTKYKYMMGARLELLRESQVEKWSDIERLSLMENEFDVFTGAPNCPNLLTLLFQHNNYVRKFSVGFFQFMPALRVLNLSSIKIRELPPDITELVELRYLNLSYSKIEQFPTDLKNWGKLKYLNLRSTRSLLSFPHGEISMLSSLQVLNLCRSCNWGFGDQCTPNLGELECLKHLKSLGITLKTILVLQVLLSNKKLRMCTRLLCIRECQGLTSITLSPSSPRSSSSSSAAATISLANMNNLQQLTCEDCVQLKELTTGGEVGEEESWSLSHLEILRLYNLPNLKIIWERSQTLLCFKNLRHVSICDCHALKDLTWLLHVQSLNAFYISNCKGIEEVILGEVTTVEAKMNMFSRLQTIDIHELPNLKSICRFALPFPSLKRITVMNSPKLNKLPLDANGAKNTLQCIQGHQEWWDRLEWEDETIKSVFQKKFEAD